MNPRKSKLPLLFVSSGHSVIVIACGGVLKQMD